MSSLESSSPPTKHFGFAKVKFIDDNLKTTIAIDTIEEYKNNWPQHDKHFDKTKIYTCTYSDEKNPEPRKYGIQIGRFVETKESEDKARFCRLEDSIIEEYNADANIEEALRNDEKEKRRKKKQQENMKKQNAINQQHNIISTKNLSLDHNNLNIKSPSRVPIKSSQGDAVKKPSKANKISILEDAEKEKGVKKKKKKKSKTIEENVTTGKKNVSSQIVSQLPIKSPLEIEVDKQSEANKIINQEDSESTDEEKENKNKHKNQAKNKKTMQKNIVSKTKLLLGTNNLKLKSPTSGRDLINSSSELFENFQQSIEKRAENASLPTIPISDQGDKSSSQDEKGRESDYKSNSDTNNSPLSHLSKKIRNSCKGDELNYAESPQRMSLFFYEKKIMELQQNIDYLEKENKELRETMEKTTMLYKKSQEKVSSCIIIQQQMKEVLLQESESNLQDSMYNSEMNCFNSIETSTPSECTTSNHSKRSAKDSGFGEITNVKKKLKTSEEFQKVIKIIFDKKIPHLPDSSGKSFGTKITPLDSTESMMHLRHSYSIPYDEWKSLLKQPTESLFCKKLLEALYPWDELKRICVKQKVKTPILTPNGANPKSEIPDEFHDMTKKALEYYIKYKANGDYVSTRILLEKLKSVGHYFSEHIKAVANRPEPKNKQPKNK